MCGIVGLFIKNPEMEANLGTWLSDMLVEMSDRGPDSAGVAIYHDAAVGQAVKLTVMSTEPDYDWSHFEQAVNGQFGGQVCVERRGTHAVITVNDDLDEFSAWLRQQHPEIYINSSGSTIEIYKEKGLPVSVVDNFRLREFKGSHALGHTRMATESKVTTEHSHPFSTGNDLCLVHNGSLSNHNRLRSMLKKHNVEIKTDNDSEVAAGYLMWKLREGATLEEALQDALQDLDGFYTFAVGTKDGFAVLRDPIGCKPAVMAETDDWVAMASEYRAIAHLPGSDKARIWEPEPAKIYSWNRN